jgi:hypothetical protein
MTKRKDSIPEAQGRSAAEDENEKLMALRDA